MSIDKTVLYYFSATGNSLAVARSLAQEFYGAEVVPLQKAMKDPSALSFDRVGIVFPVYMFGLPLIVASFLKALQVKNEAYVFAVATFGGIPGRSITLARKILAERGIKLAAGFGVLMPGNYTPLYGAVSEKRQKEIFEKEKTRIKEIADAIRNGRSGLFEEKPFLTNTVLYQLLYRNGSKMIPESDRSFWTTESCTDCGLCKEICPVENIEMKDGGPAWLHHCQHCMACLQWCPAQAIQYKKSTLGRKRYQHPLVTAMDIISAK